MQNLPFFQSNNFYNKTVTVTWVTDAHKEMARVSSFKYSMYFQMCQVSVLDTNAALSSFKEQVSNIPPPPRFYFWFSQTFPNEKI